MSPGVLIWPAPWAFAPSRDIRSRFRGDDNICHRIYGRAYLPSLAQNGGATEPGRARRRSFCVQLKWLDAVPIDQNFWG